MTELDTKPKRVKPGRKIVYQLDQEKMFAKYWEGSAEDHARHKLAADRVSDVRTQVAWTQIMAREHGIQEAARRLSLSVEDVKWATEQETPPAPKTQPVKRKKAAELDDYDDE